MNIIKLDAIDSTNRYLKDMAVKSSLPDFTVVMTNEQYGGRGQMGTIWQSEPGKNLIFSVLKRLQRFAIVQQFDLNMVVSLGVQAFLTDLEIPNVSVKWPNDILSGTSKICGILIENMFSGGNLRSSVIGIGLNVNQVHFQYLPQAGSLKLIMNTHYEIDELLHLLLNAMSASLKDFQNRDREKLRANYENVLFRKDQVSTFKGKDEQLFTGIIKGVSQIGKLQVETENGLKAFGFKEVELCY